MKALVARGSTRQGTEGAAPVGTVSDWDRVLLAALCLFAGLSAIGGGAGLAFGSDGSLMRIPLSLLAHSPFRDFFVPGLLLASIVGGVSTLAGVLLLVRHPRADAEALVAGGILSTWIVVEVLLLRHVHCAPSVR